MDVWDFIIYTMNFIFSSQTVYLQRMLGQLVHSVGYHFYIIKDCYSSLKGGRHHTPTFELNFVLDTKQFYMIEIKIFQGIYVIVLKMLYSYQEPSYTVAAFVY